MSESSVPRVCTCCINFRFSDPSPGYSEYTPGRAASMSCSMGLMRCDFDDATEEDFKKAIHTARECTEFIPDGPEERKW